jgi:anti-sigma factor RsiW
MTGTTPSAHACAEMQLLIQADLDGELDAAATAALAAHVQDCPGCAALQAELAGLSRRLRALPREQAPARLRAMLAPPAAPARGRQWRWPVMSFAAGAALAACVALLLPQRGADRLAADLVADHIRALQPGHLLDVPSSDHHTVRPWFEGRIDFAPPVPDLSAQGFVLEGGRLDVAAGRTVAVLVYRHGKHAINVFVWPGAPATGSVARAGFTLWQWSQGGLGFHAVSDLDVAEFARFVALWRSMG